jgi:hypothetical protein
MVLAVAVHETLVNYYSAARLVLWNTNYLLHLPLEVTPLEVTCLVLPKCTAIGAVPEWPRGAGRNLVPAYGRFESFPVRTSEAGS